MGRDTSTCTGQCLETEVLYLSLCVSPTDESDLEVETLSESHVRVSTSKSSRED